MSINEVHFTDEEVSMIKHSIQAHIKQCERHLNFLNGFKGSKQDDIDFVKFKVKKLKIIYDELN